MNKLTPEHLSRDAYVYVRQSTPDQLLNNPESRRRQYALETRARSLGWENVIVIDDDLGRSGGGAARPGFERLLAAICAGTAGAVFAIEASRLARNGRDWHTLLEFCVVVNSLIIDEDGIYDPRSVNDRLLLGLKGTFSELELSLFRQRSQEALRLKAARGELNTTVAIGYRRGADDRLEQDPDKRIREALSLVFRKFAEIGSVRQLVLWLRQERIELPIAVRGAQGRSVQWRLPRYNTVHRLLTNPVYAGAYVYGRTFTRVRFEGGRKVATHGIARRPEEWDVVIRNHHDGYITWEEYDRNQKVIAGNANMKGAMVRGSVRNGSGLLVGLLRCGHCGRKLKVHHNERKGARYVCTTDIANLSNKNCIAFSNMRIDAAMSAEVLRAVSPLAMAAQARLEEQMENLRHEQPRMLSEDDRAMLLALADDLPRVWNHPDASIEIRKRILRAVLMEIVVTIEGDRLCLVVHWQGGDHTRLEVVKNRVGQNRFKTDKETVQLVRELARVLPDHSIAPVLNRLRIRSARGNSWNELRVRNFRGAHQIAVYREGERAERRELILHEAASRLGINKMTVIRLIRDGILPGRQICAGAPYVIREEDLDRPAVRRAIRNGRAVSPDARQGNLPFQ